MLLEQCRPLNGGMVECGGFFVVANANWLCAVRRLSERWNDVSRAWSRTGPPFREEAPCLVLSKASSKLGPHPRPTLPGFRLQRASCSLQRHG